MLQVHWYQGKHVRGWNSYLLKENYSSTQFLTWKGWPRMLFYKNTTMYSLLCYYYLEEEATIETDASDCGLEAVLIQAGRPVAFASRTMTKTGRRYSKIEKECFALVFGCTRLNHYLHGREKITAVTDHRPLETILAKSINSAPNRLQHMMLRLQKYRLNIVYKKGTQMYISDHLSRVPSQTTERKRRK